MQYRLSAFPCSKRCINIDGLIEDLLFVKLQKLNPSVNISKHDGHIRIKGKGLIALSRCISKGLKYLETCAFKSFCILDYNIHSKSVVALI